MHTHNTNTTSNTAIAEKARVTYLLSASLAYRHTAAQCDYTHDL